MSIEIEGLSRKEARKKLVRISRKRRGKQFVVESFKDGRQIAVVMEGDKISREGNKEVKGQDFTVRILPDNESVNYLDRFFVDIIRKQTFRPDIVVPLLEGLKASIELVPTREIYRRHPELNSRRTGDLPGETVDFMLRLIRWLGVQEDVNYWGVNPNSGKPFEGRMKPYNALADYFERKLSFKSLIRKHQL